jgi:hypothetical protein
MSDEKCPKCGAAMSAAGKHRDDAGRPHGFRDGVWCLSRQLAAMTKQRDDLLAEAKLVVAAPGMVPQLSSLPNTPTQVGQATVALLSAIAAAEKPATGRGK